MYKNLLNEKLFGPVAFRYRSHKQGNLLESCTYFLLTTQRYSTGFYIDGNDCFKSKYIPCQIDITKKSWSQTVVIAQHPGKEIKKTENWMSNTVECPRGHRTLSYLKCDEKTDCFKKGKLKFNALN